ncbi:MAG: helix-turn-helix transcriptional regulator [Brevundimonas sp.]|uniref:helix-turn-helix domain-containing protein n=1 Tax=Brevundimonas sp. TaxID=1871086 RepID=UPI002732CBD1|nr:helix-turn-helix transcriptional regulator [Brevundimonas sp.]MDP3405221.1 helix-turn-helix transcriptional regulator [Brevundimonas sp.]
MDVRKKLGSNVQRLRREKGLSQEELADLAGLHRTYVSGVERGVRNPTLTVIDRLARALGVEMAVVVGFD